MLFFFFFFCYYLNLWRNEYLFFYFNESMFTRRMWELKFMNELFFVYFCDWKLKKNFFFCFLDFFLFSRLDCSVVFIHIGNAFSIIWTADRALYHWGIIYSHEQLCATFVYSYHAYFENKNTTSDIFVYLCA